MLAVIGLIALIIVVMYFVFGVLVILTTEIVGNIVGAFDVPMWLDDLYDFVIDKMFFFFNL
jgi:hypothetical protein